MADNKIPKLRKSRTDASEKILERINIGKELLETQISSGEKLGKLMSDTRKWTDYNKTLFGNLFDKSPLSRGHGSVNAVLADQSLYEETADHKKDISRWINDLESIYESNWNYTRNYQVTLNRLCDTHDTMNNENKKIFIGHGGSPVWRELKDFLVEYIRTSLRRIQSYSTRLVSTTSDRLKEMLESCVWHSLL